MSSVLPTYPIARTDTSTPLLDPIHISLLVSTRSIYVVLEYEEKVNTEWRNK